MAEPGSVALDLFLDTVGHGFLLAAVPPSLQAVGTRVSPESKAMRAVPSGPLCASNSSHRRGS
ncbi:MULTISPECIES: hypothetical protein [unclassified Streptomyces]|uniref:hypothetical protein n=1 Tax=unclassified Streptomyces TaxID=2593676 RepID=UPI00159F2FF2|nr:MULTISPECIES: hypothetical protein [unclassified Streptomyces]